MEKQEVQVTWLNLLCLSLWPSICFGNDEKVYPLPASLIGILAHPWLGGQNLNFAIPSEYLVNLLKLFLNAPHSGSTVEAREKDFYSPSLSLSSGLVQESDKGAGSQTTSIHDLDFIEHARPNYKKKKSKPPAEDLFIMTR